MSVVQSLQRLEELFIDGIDGLKHMIGSGTGDGSNTSMELSAAKGNSRSLMPNLKTVGILECNLQNLKLLTVCVWETDKCWVGEVLFSMSVAQSLQQLEELLIMGVDGLKHIVGNGGEDGSNTDKEFILPSQNSRFLMPNLKMIQITACNELESLLPICCVEGLSQLQILEIIDVPNLRYVFGGCDHIDHSSLQYGNQVFLPRLEQLRFEELENLIDMCPKNYPVKWRSPSEIIVNDCPNLTTTFVLETGKCGLGEVLFSMSVVQSLPQLEHLTSMGIDGLKHVTEGGRGDGSNTSKDFILPQWNSRFLMPV
ncbi:hypothetical protein VNO77_42887 [Canavalia gladiata]|uniref:Disease resistance protein At4g27190-like leucine-rich repeats domain-containing protein n=1 Tax=Canavalia gladiata TaxID=3824 RepID=A0AAN9JT78_CANGL